MTLPYLVRLLCICLASFFLVHLAAGLAVLAVADAAVRTAERLPARRAARLLLALRLLPAGLAAFAVAGLCVPSYLWLEPAAGTEEVGLVCLSAALLGAAVWAISILRGSRAAARSFLSMRHFRRIGLKARLPGERSTVWLVEGAAPVLALAGIVHPRMVISRPVMTALSAGQLAVALRHERAHWASHDNLKRLLVLLAPGLLPSFRGFEALERGWGRTAEWAADDTASARNPLLSLSLASALVRLARLGGAWLPPEPASSLLTENHDLQARVDRLLVPSRPAGSPARRTPRLAAAAALVLAGAIVAMMLRPATLSSVHGVLEHLVH